VRESTFANVVRVIGGPPFEVMPHVTFYDAQVMSNARMTHRISHTLKHDLFGRDSGTKHCTHCFRWDEEQSPNVAQVIGGLPFEVMLEIKYKSV